MGLLGLDPGTGVVVAPLLGGSGICEGSADIRERLAVVGTSELPVILMAESAYSGGGGSPEGPFAAPFISWSTTSGCDGGKSRRTHMGSRSCDRNRSDKFADFSL
jgi:hypothetical protein